MLRPSTILGPATILGQLKSTTAQSHLSLPIILQFRKMSTHAKINVPGAGELNLPVGLFM